MSEWLIWFLVFYTIVALVWTVKRYLSTTNKEHWKGNWASRTLESFTWIIVLMATGYGNENKKEEK